MILLPLTIALALVESAYRPVPTDESFALNQAPEPQRKILVKSKARKACDLPQGVAKLPFSHGHRFCTLDEYLGYLETRAGPIGQPWWREVRRDVFEHVSTATNATRETATRAELMRRFGFNR